MRRRSLAVAIVVTSAFVIAAACLRLATPVLSGPAGTASTQPLSGESLYQLQSTWTTDAGRAVRLQDLGGSINVLALVFTQCSGSCPILVKELQMLEREMPAQLLRDTRVVLVTIDPQNDTLAALRAYRLRMKLDTRRWILLRGESADVRELAAVLGFNYAPAEARQFAHSNILTVLDRRGEIVLQQAGTGGDPETLLAALREPQSDWN